MSAPQKFMFDNSFDNNTEVIDPLVELKARFEDKIEKAKADAFAEGRLAGEKDALAKIESQTKDALEKIANLEQKIQQDFKEELKKLEAKAIEFGITAGTTLAGELMRKEPMPLIEQFFKEAFEIVRGVPQLTARLNPALVEKTKEVSKVWQSESGYSGDLEIIEDTSLKDCDVAITWKDGGISQNVDEIMNSIKSALNNFFLAQKMPTDVDNSPALETEQTSTDETLNKSENSS